MISCRRIKSRFQYFFTPLKFLLVEGGTTQVSNKIGGLLFTGIHSDYHFADTWFPSLAADGNLYSPFTDGDACGEFSNSDGYTFKKEGCMGTFNCQLHKATTGQAVLIGDTPLYLTVKSLGTIQLEWRNNRIQPSQQPLWSGDARSQTDRRTSARQNNEELKHSGDRPVRLIDVGGFLNRGAGLMYVPSELGELLLGKSGLFSLVACLQRHVLHSNSTPIF